MHVCVCREGGPWAGAPTCHVPRVVCPRDPRPAAATAAGRVSAHKNPHDQAHVRAGDCGGGDPHRKPDGLGACVQTLVAVRVPSAVCPWCARGALSPTIHAPWGGHPDGTRIPLSPRRPSDHHVEGRHECRKGAVGRDETAQSTCHTTAIPLIFFAAAGAPMCLRLVLRLCSGPAPSACFKPASCVSYP